MFKGFKRTIFCQECSPGNDLKRIKFSGEQSNLSLQVTDINQQFINLELLSKKVSIAHSLKINSVIISSAEETARNYSHEEAAREENGSEVDKLEIKPMAVLEKIESSHHEQAKEREENGSEVDKLIMKPMVVSEKNKLSHHEQGKEREENGSEVDKLKMKPMVVSEKNKLSHHEQGKESKVNGDSNNTFLEEGTLVWSRLNVKHSFWPAIVVNESRVGLSPCNENQCVVFWLKDYTVSKVLKKKILNYTSLVPKLDLKSSGSKKWKEAIFESIDLFAQQTYKVELTMGINGKLEWLKNVVRDPDYFAVKVKNLETSEQNNNITAENYDEIDFSLLRNNLKDDLGFPEYLKGYARAIKMQNLQNELKTEEIAEERKKTPLKFCLACNEDTENMHPLFNVKLCCACQVIYRGNLFLCSQTRGRKMFCIICGIKKSKHFCEEGYLWAFCDFCIKNYFNLPTWKVIKNWTFFLKNNCKYKKGQKSFSTILKINENWWNNLSLLYKENPTPENGPILSIKISKLIYIKNGIGSGTINFNRFYFDEQATSNHINVNDESNENYEKELNNALQDIDDKQVILLIGSAPNIIEPRMLDDESDVEINQLFMEFFDVFCKITRKTRGKNVEFIFLFECSAAIKIETYERNTRFLEISPILIDIEGDIGVNRYRMLWSNVCSTEEEFRNFFSF